MGQRLDALERRSRAYNERVCGERAQREQGERHRSLLLGCRALRFASWFRPEAPSSRLAFRSPLLARSSPLPPAKRIMSLKRYFALGEVCFPFSGRFVARGRSSRESSPFFCKSGQAQRAGRRHHKKRRCAVYFFAMQLGSQGVAQRDWRGCAPCSCRWWSS